MIELLDPDLDPLNYQSPFIKIDVIYYNLSEDESSLDEEGKMTQIPTTQGVR